MELDLVGVGALVTLVSSIAEVLYAMLKGLGRPVNDEWKMPMAVVLASVILYATKMNILASVGVPGEFVGTLGPVLTAIVGGMLVGRLAAPVHDALKYVERLGAAGTKKA